MPSTLFGAPSVVGNQYVVPVLHPSGKVLQPRFRNATISGYADLPTSQAAMQAAATALADATVATGPNATNIIANLR